MLAQQNEPTPSPTKIIKTVCDMKNTAQIPRYWWCQTKKMSIFWDLKLHSLSTLKKQAGDFSKTLATIHQTSPCPRIIWSDYIHI